VTLHVLGAGGSYPPPGYGGPSLLVEAPGSRLLLDCGDSCAPRLEALGFSPCEVDAVYISHRHADHWSGLFQLLTARAAEGCPETRVLAAPRVAEDLHALLSRLTPGNSVVSIEAVEGAVGLGGGVEMELFESRHPVPTYGVALREGGSGLAAYTADTAYEPRLAGVLRGFEVLVVDATLPSRGPHGAEVEYHMTVRQAWSLAREAGAGLAVAFHLSPESLAEARRARLEGLLVPGELASLTIH
jgi:ribonuclease Z